MRFCSKMTFAFDRVAMISLVMAVFVCGCDERGNPAEMNVFAAASVADVVRTFAREFESLHSCRVRVTSGASGVLCRQIERGAPCDVFVPADPSYLDKLSANVRLQAGSRRALAGNELVVVCRREDDWRPDLLDDPESQLVIANPEHAPAGAYAVVALQRKGLWHAVRNRIVYAGNVRLAARYAARGATRFAVVYATDAAAFPELKISHRFDAEDHGTITYVGAICAGAANSTLAADFLSALAAADDGWRRHGFTKANHQE